MYEIADWATFTARGWGLQNGLPALQGHAPWMVRMVKAVRSMGSCGALFRILLVRAEKERDGSMREDENTHMCLTRPFSKQASTAIIVR